MTELFQILAQEDQRLLPLLNPQQLVYGGQKQSQRHVIYVMKDERISEIQLTPDLRKIADVKGPFAVGSGLHPIQLFATSQFLVVLMQEGILQSFVFDSQTRELKLLSQCPSELKPIAFDVCEIRRSFRVQRCVITAEQNKLVQHTLQKDVRERAFRVVFSALAPNGKDYVIAEGYISAEGEFTMPTTKFFKDPVTQVFATAENVFFVANKQLSVMSEAQNIRLCGLSKIQKVVIERIAYQPLTVEDGNFYKYPSSDAPTNVLLKKLRDKMLNPEICIDQQLAETRITNKIDKVRQNFVSTIVAAFDDRGNIVIACIQEGTCQILKQYIIPNAPSDCQQLLIHQQAFLLAQSTKGQAYCYIISENAKEPIQVINGLSCFVSTQQNKNFNPLILGFYEEQFAQLTFNNIPKIIGQLQNLLQFQAALQLVGQIGDQKTASSFTRQLTAQLGLLMFNQGNYSEAYQLFLKSNVDPLSILYLFSDKSCLLADPSVTKQQFLIEQLQVNLPQSFLIPIVQFNDRQSKDRYSQIINGLKTYIFGWRQNLFDQDEFKNLSNEQLQEYFTPQQLKQLQLIDEALIKSVILDVLGVEVSELSILLQTQNLFISDKVAIQLLKDKFPEILMQLFKQQHKFKLALELLMQGQQTNQALLPQTLTQVANFLLEVGLGPTSSPVNEQLRQIHFDYYQCIFLSNPSVFIDIFSLKPANSHQLDILIGIQFLDCMAETTTMNSYKPDGSIRRVLTMPEIKCLVITAALESRNYYQKDMESIYLKLVSYYVKIVQSEVDILLQSLKSQQSYHELFQLIDSYIDYKRILKNLSISEDDIFDQVKSQQVNYIDVLQEIENELLGYEFVVEQFVGEGEAVIFKERALTEQIGGIIGEYRKKLNKTLKRLDGAIDYQKFVAALPEKMFAEERAVLYCKRYNFEKALQLLAIGMGRPLLAEAVCDFVYSDSLQVSIENRQLDIYAIMLKVYLTAASKPFLRAAYTLLISKYDKIPPSDVLELLPKKLVKLEDLQVYLRIILSQYKLQELDYKLLEIVNVGELYFLNNQFSKAQAAECVQTRQQKCSICLEIFKKDVVVLANGRLVCARCWQTNQSQCENLQKMKTTKGFRCFTDVFD